jgi:coproporphyrinogen III oxidase
MRGRFERMIRGVQAKIVAAVEEVDGREFRQDAWTRPAGGGGITRVLQEGNVWEKAGVAVSVVYGSMPAEAYRVAVGKDIPYGKVSRLGWAACLSTARLVLRQLGVVAGVCLPLLAGYQQGGPISSSSTAPACLLALSLLQDDHVPFFAAGVSSVMHPYNPHCPTLHFNYR